MAQIGRLGALRRWATRDPKKDPHLARARAAQERSFLDQARAADPQLAQVADTAEGRDERTGAEAELVVDLTAPRLDGDRASARKFHGGRPGPDDEERLSVLERLRAAVARLDDLRVDPGRPGGPAGVQPEPGRPAGEGSAV